jgi:hypothetical protein
VYTWNLTVIALAKGYNFRAMAFCEERERLLDLFLAALKAHDDIRNCQECRDALEAHESDHGWAPEIRSTNK